jgi:hypothetical protein
MNTQHTPGPWAVAVEIFDNDGMPETAIQAMNGGATVAVALDFGRNNPDMRKANACLIAAAPCLLAELRKARAALNEQLEILIQSHSDPKTGLITDDADLRAIESDQDLINGIDRVIDQAEGGAA